MTKPTKPTGHAARLMLTDDDYNALRVLAARRGMSLTEHLAVICREAIDAAGGTKKLLGNPPKS